MSQNNIKYWKRKDKEIKGLDKYKPKIKFIEQNIYIEYYILGNKIEVFLDEKYPFGCPKININNQTYINFLNNKSSKKIKKLLDLKCCLCCNSVTKNWAACKKLKTITDEIENIINTLNKIYESKCALFIAYKHNIPGHLIYNFII